jgi:GR25 family glycosyltransferase involved in LPS biosynthesis
MDVIGSYKMISKIFIIHYTKLKERKIFLLNHLPLLFPNIPIEFIEEFDQEVLEEKQINQIIDLQKFNERFCRNMKISEISLAFKYKEALKRAANESGEYFLILEDDIIFKEFPLIYIEKIFKKCYFEDIDFDCIFLGEAGLRVGDDRDIFFKKEYPATNGMCTVLYKKNAILKMLDGLEKEKISQPIDFEFNDRFEKMKFNVYWGKAITRHGSVIGKYKSSLR